MSLESILPEFDSSLLPKDTTNLEAAKARNLIFNSESGFYEDEDGCQIRDEYGQVL